MRAGTYSVIFAGLVIAGLWLLPAPAGRRLNAAIRDAFAPFLAAPMHLRDWRQALAGREHEADIARLNEQVAALKLEISALQALERENRELRNLLGLAQRLPHRLQAARILSRNLNSWWQSARLDRGARDGVTVGLPVLAADGLIGRVTAVSARTSDILFLIDPGCRVAGTIPRINAFGIVQGQGTGARGAALCRMDFIARDAAVSAGDEVLSSGLGGVFPPGLPIGYVRQASPDASGLHQTAEILPAADFRNPQLVFLVMADAPPMATPDGVMDEQ